MIPYGAVSSTNRRPSLLTRMTQPGRYGSTVCTKFAWSNRSPRFSPMICAFTALPITRASPRAPSDPMYHIQSPVAVAAGYNVSSMSRLAPKPPVARITADAITSSSPTAAPTTAPSCTSSRSTRWPKAMSIPRSRHARWSASMIPCPRSTARAHRGTRSSPPKISCGWNSTPRSTSQSRAAPLSFA